MAVFRELGKLISIHTPARGVTIGGNAINDYKKNFNPHSRKGSDPFSDALLSAYPNFNPHSRKGSDFDRFRVIIREFDISIHTPARGVTEWAKLTYKQDVISIHTPARGVTISTPIKRVNKQYFNPHSRKGSDLQNSAVNYIGKDFNPHSRKGSDFALLAHIGNIAGFQSTLPQGE